MSVSQYNDNLADYPIEYVGRKEEPTTFLIVIATFLAIVAAAMALTFEGAPRLISIIALGGVYVLFLVSQIRKRKEG